MEYKQTDARKMLSLINDFRYDEGASSDLEYDYKLEKAAMQRAAEITVQFSHTRPDGSDYKATLAENGLNISARGIIYGENILFDSVGADNYTVAFNSFSTDAISRANLLKDFEAVGLSHVVINDVDYWVMVFADEVIDSQYTNPVDGTRDVLIKTP